MSDNGYLDSKQFHNILSYYERCQRKGESCMISSDDYADIAEYYANTGHNRKALKALDTAIEIYGNPTLPLVMKARYMFLEKKDFDAAEEYFARVEDKSDLEYVYAWAEMLVAGDETGAAEKFLAAKFGEMDGEDRDNFALDAAELYLDYYMTGKAVAWLKKCGDKDSLDFKELYGRALMAAGKFGESEKVFNGLLDENPFSKDYWNALASSQMLRGDINGSITSSEYALAIDPGDLEAIKNRAYAHMMFGNYEEMLRICGRETEKNVDDAAIYMLQGIALLRLGRVEEAREMIRKAKGKQRASPERMEGMFKELGFSFARDGCVGEAMRCIEEAEKIYAGEPGDAELLRAQVYLENKDGEKAKECVIGALRHARENPSVYLHVARLLYDYDILELAYGLLKLLAKSDDPELCKEVYPSLALCCYKMDKRREFVVYLGKAVSASPEMARFAMGWMFPEGTDPKDYHKHVKELFK